MLCCFTFQLPFNWEELTTFHFAIVTKKLRLLCSHLRAPVVLHTDLKLLFFYKRWVRQELENSWGLPSRLIAFEKSGLFHTLEIWMAVFYSFGSKLLWLDLGILLTTSRNRMSSKSFFQMNISAFALMPCLLAWAKYHIILLTAPRQAERTMSSAKKMLIISLWNLHLTAKLN